MCMSLDLLMAVGCLTYMKCRILVNCFLNLMFSDILYKSIQALTVFICIGFPLYILNVFFRQVCPNMPMHFDMT